MEKTKKIKKIKKRKKNEKKICKNKFLNYRKKNLFNINKINFSMNKIIIINYY